MLSNKDPADYTAPRIGPDYQATLPLSPPLPPTIYLTHSPSPFPLDDDATYSSNCSSSPVLHLDGNQPAATSLVATAAAASTSASTNTSTLTTTFSSSSLTSSSSAAAAVEEGGGATDMDVVAVEPVTHTHTGTHTHAGTDLAALETNWLFVSVFSYHFFNNGKQWHKIVDGLKEDGVKCLPKKKRDAKNALLHYYHQIFKHTEGYLSYVLQSPAYTEHVEVKYAALIPPTYHEEDLCYHCRLVYEDNPEVKTWVLCESCSNTACKRKCSGGATKDVEWHCQECKDKYNKAELAEATKVTHLAWDAVDVKRRNAVATIIATLKVPKVMRRIEARKQWEEEQKHAMLNLRKRE